MFEKLIMCDAQTSGGLLISSPKEHSENLLNELNKNSQLVSIGISLPLIIGYNAKLKKFPLIGNIVVALILSLSFIYAGFVFDNIKPLIIPAVLAFGLTLIREIVKDMADVIGDKSVGLKTFPIVYGENKTIILCTVSLV